MREANGPAMEPISNTAHLLQPMIDRAVRDPGWPVAAYRDDDHFVDVTAGEFHERVRQLAKGLIGGGVEAGDRVALMSHTRLEWLLVDYAILAVGGVTVPVYETSSAEQLQWILSDSEAVALVVETPTMAQMHAAMADATPACRASFTIEEGGLAELVRRGAHVDDGALDERIAALRRDGLATIVYTSGTTGRPKGCAITHGNLRANVLQNLDAVRSMLEPREVGLMFLPLAHTLSKIIALVGVEWGINSRSRPTSRTFRRSCCSHDRRWLSRSHGCSRRCSTARSRRPMPKDTAKSSIRRPKSPSAGPRTRPGATTR